MPSDEDPSPWVYRTAVASLAVQAATGAASVAGLFLPYRRDEAGALRTIFFLELSSQVIEFLWYAAAVARRRAIVTWTRYADWVVSTPLMLVSLAFFFTLRGGEPRVERALARGALWCALAFNQLMLSVGLAIEVGGVDRRRGVAAGTLALVGSFTSLGRFVVGSDAWSVAVFYTVYAVWSLYGAAALLSHARKNVAYNALDVVSKNCYGIVLLFYAVRDDLL